MPERKTIPFNIPTFVGKEIDYIKEVIKSGNIQGDGPFSQKCMEWFEKVIGVKKAYLTPSCTSAIQISAIATIKKGDEVIAPSFTSPATVNPFIICGAKIKFVDIKPDTMNIDEELVESAVSDKTRAVVVVHYGGIACEMDKILEIVEKYGFILIEDAAHALLSKYKGKYLGTFGKFAALSFHQTKNITCGQGGAILINDLNLTEKVGIIRQNGTNREKFLKGLIDKYWWIDVGSSFIMSEISAAFLYAQLEMSFDITRDRVMKWNLYYELFGELEEKGLIERPKIPPYIEHNGHIFFIKLENKSTRDKLMDYLKNKGITTSFHFIPLHTTDIGKNFEFIGEDKATKESERLLRFPIFYGISTEQIEYIFEITKKFFF